MRGGRSRWLTVAGTAVEVRRADGDEVRMGVRPIAFDVSFCWTTSCLKYKVVCHVKAAFSSSYIDHKIVASFKLNVDVSCELPHDLHSMRVWLAARLGTNQEEEVLHRMGSGMILLHCPLKITEDYPMMYSAVGPELLIGISMICC